MPEVLHGGFDHVLAAQVLEHVPWFQAQATLAGWAVCLKPGAALHVVVPSLEWAARQVLSEETSPALLAHLYGGLDTPWNVHLGGFTLRLLRAMFQRAGLKVQRARSGQYTLRLGAGVYVAEQHYVMGVSREL
jgi:predicted SAM-dependent methyltransferase